MSLVSTIIFYFLMTFLITHISHEIYMVCSMKIQNNSQHKCIAIGLASDYLSLNGSRIQWIKLRDLGVIVLSVFVFSVIFCYHIKRLWIIFNFLKIEKAIFSDGYPNLDDKLIRGCVRFKINILILVVAKRL